jgi:hypothetical protein
MSNDIINMFNGNNDNSNQEILYSESLLVIYNKHKIEFPEEFPIDDAFQLTTRAWNLGNIKFLVEPDEFEKMITVAPGYEKMLDLLLKMIDYKSVHFNHYDLFIADFELENIKGEIKPIVVLEDAESYMENMLDEYQNESMEFDFEENFIDRFAIIVQAKIPFQEFLKKALPDEEIITLTDTHLYLIDDCVEDVENWLLQNYEAIFEKELETREIEKKNWPRSRTFEKFQEWFSVSLSDFIYDCEPKPVRKIEL